MFRLSANKAVWLAGLVGAVLLLMPQPAQAATSNSPRIRSLVAATAMVAIDSFHYDSASDSNNFMDVEVCAVTATGSLDESNCTTSSFTLSSSAYQTFDITDNADWPSGGGGSRRIRARTYTSTATDAFFSPWSGEYSWTAAGAQCTAANHPAIDLGTLGLSGGATLANSGQIEGRYYEAPCKGFQGYASNYFQFTIAEGEAGAIKIDAPKGQSTLIADLLLRSGASYNGSILWRDDYHQARDDALAAGLVDAGTYTLQVRAATRTLTSSNNQAAGGAYKLTITRLQPALVSTTVAPVAIDTTWDVGNAVHRARYGTGNNAIALAIKIDYQAVEGDSWTEVTPSLAPPNTTSTAEARVTGLELGTSYTVRAAYTNATHYTESAHLETKAFIRLSASPYRVEAISELIEESQAKHRIRVAWETPEIDADANLTYRYATRLNTVAVQFNPTGKERVLETVFDWRAPAGGVLEIEVNNTFICPSGGRWTQCELTYDRRDYTIPAGDAWSTPWSAPALVTFPPPNSLAAGTIPVLEPDPAIAGAINLAYDVSGNSEPVENRPVRTLAMVIGGLLALGAGCAIGYKAEGPKVGRVVLGAGIFITLIAGVATVLFAVPRELVMVMATASIVLAAVFLIRRFAL